MAHEGSGRGLQGQQVIPGLCVQLLHAGKHASNNRGFGHALIVAGTAGPTALLAFHDAFHLLCPTQFCRG